MDRATYFDLDGDRTVNTVGVFLEPRQARGAAAMAEVTRRAAAQGYPVQRRAELHRAIREVFDATFAVTRSLRLLAVVTAFFGIAGALLTLFTERRREFGIFRALGFSSGQAVGVTFLEGVGLGVASFALSAVSGTVVAALLIRVINLRSFHWTVFFHPAWESYALSAAVALGASLAAAAYPAWLVFRTYPNIQLREE
jgi:putative ABC transport system permease protein